LPLRLGRPGIASPDGALHIDLERLLVEADGLVDDGIVGHPLAQIAEPRLDVAAAPQERAELDARPMLLGEDLEPLDHEVAVGREVDLDAGLTEAEEHVREDRDGARVEVRLGLVEDKNGIRIDGPALDQVRQDADLLIPSAVCGMV
jgi:hypothetical protein